MRLHEVLRRAAALLALAALVASMGDAARASRVRSGGGLTVRFELAGPAAGAPLRVALRREPSREDDAGGAVAAVDVEVGPAGTRIELPPGPPCRLSAACDAAVVWPRSVQAEDGDEVVLRIEPLADLVLRTAEPAETLGHLAFVADRFEAASGPAARIDALQVAIDLTSPVPRPAPEGAHVLLPRGTVWWCLADVGGTPVLAHIRADEGGAVLARRPLRRLVSEPRVAGAPIPPGTLVAPGRLDLCAAAFVRDAVLRGTWRGAVIRGRKEGRGADLAAADQVTLAHPAFGIAYASWHDEGIDARPGPCEIRFEAPSGRPFSASVAVWPAWPGADADFSRPFDRWLRIECSGAKSLPVRGLLPGRYRFDYAAADGRGRPGRSLRRGTCRLAAESPRAVVTLVTGAE
jgi:hypothetical protein